MERIYNIGNTIIDFEKVRAIKLNNYNNLGKTNILEIEYFARIEYSRNPFTNEIEKNEIVDIIKKEYPDFETAQLNQISIEESWNEYLKNKNNDKF